MTSLTVVIVNASEVLSSPSSPTHARSTANDTLQRLWTRDANELITSATTILQSDYPVQAKFHALIAVRELFLRRHHELQNLLTPTLSFLLNGMFSSAPTTPATVLRTLINTNATLLKLSLLSTQEDQSQLLTQMLSMQPTEISLNLLTHLLQQLSRPHGGLTLEVHEICHQRYQQQFLNQTLTIAAGSVVAATPTTAPPTTATPTTATPTTAAAGMRLLSEVLGWDFRFRGSPTSLTSTLPTFCPPESWRHNIMSLGSMIVRARDELPTTSRGDVDDCLLSLSGTHGDVFDSHAGRAAFVDTLLRDVIRTTRGVNDVYVTSSIVARSLKNLSIDAIVHLANGGEILMTTFSVMYESLAALSNALSSGSSAEDVDYLARGFDHLLSSLSRLMEIKLLPKIRRGAQEDDPVRIRCSEILSRLSSCCSLAYKTFVGFAMSQSSTLVSASGVAAGSIGSGVGSGFGSGVGSSSIASDDDDGGAVLADSEAMWIRFQQIGVLGRFSAGDSVPMLTQLLSEQLSHSPPDLACLCTLMSLCTCTLVRFNGKTTVHRLVPAGIRSCPHILQLIELLLQIVVTVTQTWRDTPTTQHLDPRFRRLTNETSSCMIGFAKVWLDPTSTRTDPLDEKVRTSLLSYKSQIVEMLVNYIGAVLLSNRNQPSKRATAASIRRHASAASAASAALPPSAPQILLASSIKRNDRMDSEEIQNVIELLVSLVRGHGGTLLRDCAAWSMLCSRVVEVHSSGNPNQFGRMLSPYVVGKVVELTSRGSMMGACCQDSFDRLAVNVGSVLGVVGGIAATVENQPVVLRVLETVRGVMRCARDKGRWKDEIRSVAEQKGWSVSTPMLGVCTHIAEQYAAAVPNTKVVVSVCRIWSHFLKVYNAKLSGDNFGGVFSELERILGTFRATATDEAVRALVICQFASLLVQLLMTQTQVIMRAFMAKNANSNGSAATSAVTATAAPDAIGDRVVVVVFQCVNQLFACITPSLLQYPRVCERFVALSCFLVEMFPDRLMSGTVDMVNSFCSCLEFAMDSTDEEVMNGATDGMAVITSMEASRSSHMTMVITRVTLFFLKGLVREYKKERAELFFQIVQKSPLVCRAAATSFCAGNQQLHQKLAVIFQSVSHDDFHAKVSTLRLLNVV